jgi:uncharacterized UPF0160 family protein
LVSYFDHHQAEIKCKYKRKIAVEEASFAAIFIAVEQSHSASMVVELLEAV